MRNIMVVTGTRAEYGILRPVLKAIKKDPNLRLSLLVTGMHLSHEFGHTIDEIEKDGFKTDSKIDMLLSSDSKSSMAKSLAIGIMGMVQAIEEANPDLVLVCGDRSEPLAAAISASYLNVPLAHLLGGDTATGSNIDDSIRHAITKFAHIHFVATKAHKERIIRMGEEEWRTHEVGSPAIDSIINDDITPSSELAIKFGLDLAEPLILAVQHPTSVSYENASGEIKETLAALVELGLQTVFIYPNADPGGREMIKSIGEYEKYPFIKFFRSIPHQDYLSLMKNASVMVGNSSSGIIEAASFHLPVVNIGVRQEGRERSDNIIDVGSKKDEIIEGIDKALTDDKFRAKVKNCKNPYGDGKTSDRIVKILREIEIDEKLLRKKMTY